MVLLAILICAAVAVADDTSSFIVLDKRHPANFQQYSIEGFTNAWGTQDNYFRLCYGNPYIIVVPQKVTDCTPLNIAYRTIAVDNVSLGDIFPSDKNFEMDICTDPSTGYLILERNCALERRAFVRNIESPTAKFIMIKRAHLPYIHNVDMLICPSVTESGRPVLVAGLYRYKDRPSGCKPVVNVLRKSYDPTYWPPVFLNNEYFALTLPVDSIPTVNLVSGRFGAVKIKDALKNCQ